VSNPPKVSVLREGIVLKFLGGGPLLLTSVGVEKLFLAKFAKMKLRQDAL